MPTVMLTEHFSLQELTYSETASREGLTNTPDLKALSNLKLLASVLEKVRLLCGSNPVTITSGYRSPEVNEACGGSDNSAHMSGLAADFIIPMCGDPLMICQLIEPFMEDYMIDQLINEYPPDGWVHLGLADPIELARCQCLTITYDGTVEGF